MVPNSFFFSFVIAKLLLHIKIHVLLITTALIVVCWDLTGKVGNNFLQRQWWRHLQLKSTCLATINQDTDWIVYIYICLSLSIVLLSIGEANVLNNSEHLRRRVTSLYIDPIALREYFMELYNIHVCVCINLYYKALWGIESKTTEQESIDVSNNQFWKSNTCHIMWSSLYNYMI